MGPDNDAEALSVVVALLPGELVAGHRHAEGLVYAGSHASPPLATVLYLSVLAFA